MKITIRHDHYIHFVGEDIAARVERLEAQGVRIMTELETIQAALDDANNAIAETKTALGNIRTDTDTRVAALQAQIDALQAAGGISATDAAALSLTAQGLRDVALGLKADAQQLDSEDAAGA